MSGPTNFVAILPVKASKVELFEKHMTELIQYSEKNEPGVWTYELNKELAPEGDVVRYVVKEQYKDMQYMKEVHSKSDMFKSFFKTMTEEGAMASPPSIIPYGFVTGFVDSKDR